MNQEEDKGHDTCLENITSTTAQAEQQNLYWNQQQQQQEQEQQQEQQQRQEVYNNNNNNEEEKETFSKEGENTPEKAENHVPIQQSNRDSITSDEDSNENDFGVNTDETTSERVNSSRGNNEVIKTRNRSAAIFSPSPSLESMSAKEYQKKFSKEGKSLVLLLQKENNELRRQIKKMQKRLEELESLIGVQGRKSNRFNLVTDEMNVDTMRMIEELEDEDRTELDAENEVGAEEMIYSVDIHERYKIVLDKLKKIKKANLTENTKKMETVARMLSDPNLLLASFLSKSEEGTQETINSIIDMYSSGGKHSVDVDNLVQTLKEHGILASHEVYLKEISKTKHLRVKLVIVDQNNTSQKLTQLLSPILNVMHMAPQFGTFHSAIMIGPWYLDWNSSSLVIPRKCCSRGSILAYDIGKDLSEMDIDYVLSTVAEYIVEWNTRYTYNLRNRNCHNFVTDLCKRLNIKLEFGNGLLGKYMNNLKKYGVCEMVIDLNDELKNKFNRKRLKFETHAQLDDFVKANRSLLSSEDMVLLKSFDRAFWLRHFANPIYGIFKPHGCPFRNPVQTGSIIHTTFKPLLL